MDSVKGQASLPHPRCCPIQECLRQTKANSVGTASFQNGLGRDRSRASGQTWEGPSCKNGAWGIVLASLHQEYEQDEQGNERLQRGHEETYRSQGGIVCLPLHPQRRKTVENSRTTAPFPETFPARFDS